jgi:hypothetical protein
VSHRSVPYLRSGLTVLSAERESEASALSVQLSQALSIVQGVALKHAPSKRQLGRQYSLEILLDLMLASRHLAAMPNPQTRKEKGMPEIPVLLTSAVIDTLLCILVDSPPALRLFEEVNGVQAVVKLLKRAGMPREVRCVTESVVIFSPTDFSLSQNEMS